MDGGEGRGTEVTGVCGGRVETRERRERGDERECGCGRFVSQLIAERCDIVTMDSLYTTRYQVLQPMREL